MRATLLILILCTFGNLSNGQGSLKVLIGGSANISKYAPLNSHYPFSNSTTDWMFDGKPFDPTILSTPDSFYSRKYPASSFEYRTNSMIYQWELRGKLTDSLDMIHCWVMRRDNDSIPSYYGGGAGTPGEIYPNGVPDMGAWLVMPTTNHDIIPIGPGINPLHFSISGTNNYITYGDNAAPFAFAYDRHGNPDSLYSYDWGGNHEFPVMAKIVQTSGTAKSIDLIASTWRTAAGYEIIVAQYVGSGWMVISENKSNEGSLSWDDNLDSLDGNTLYYVSGGLQPSDTASFQFTKSVSGNGLFGLSSFRKPHIYTNGQLIDVTTTQYTLGGIKAYTITESDTFYDAWSSLQYLVDHRPIGGYTQQPAFYHGTPAFVLHIILDKTDYGFVAYHGFEMLRPMRIISYSYVQDQWNHGVPYNGPYWQTKYRRYRHSVDSVNDGAKAFQFRFGVNQIDTFFNAGKEITSNLWENGIANDRVHDVTEQTIDGVGCKITLNMGCIRVNDSLQSAGTLTSTQKTYINELSYYYPALRSAGFKKKFIAYKFWNPSDSAFAFNVRDTLQYIADAQDTLVHLIPVPAGKTFHVTSTNAIMLSGDTFKANTTFYTMWMGYRRYYAFVQGYFQ